MYAYFAVHAKVSKSERRQNSGRQFQYWRAGQFAFRNERHDFQFRGDTRSAADSFAQRTFGHSGFHRERHQSDGLRRVCIRKQCLAGECDLCQYRMGTGTLHYHKWRNILWKGRLFGRIRTYPHV